MQPVNTKSLLTFIFSQMEKLDNKEITVDEANAQSNLAKQANNILSYELKRSETLMNIGEFNQSHTESVRLRDAESKAFDNTI